jgi:hypothetical protein
MAFRDIRKSRKWLSMEEIRLLLLALLILVGLLVLNIYLARVLPGGEQFFLRWSGARAFLFEQIEPYSVTTAGRTQTLAYGGEAFSNEHPYALNDPFHIVLFYIPLALLSDFAIARGLWMLLSEAVLIGLTYSFIRSLEWEPPGWLYFLLMVFGVFGYYSLVAFGSGTPALAIVFLIYCCISMGSKCPVFSLCDCLCYCQSKMARSQRFWDVSGDSACDFIPDLSRLGASLYTQCAFRLVSQWKPDVRSYHVFMVPECKSPHWVMDFHLSRCHPVLGMAWLD